MLSRPALALRRRWPFLLFLCGFLSQGCLIGPDYKTPPAPVATKWEKSLDAGIDTSHSDYADWWSVFNDPVMVKLINLAYRQNLDLRTAGVRVLEARAQLGAAIGEIYPQQQTLVLRLSYNRFLRSLPYKIVSNIYASDTFGAQAAMGNRRLGQDPPRHRVRRRCLSGFGRSL